MKNKKKRIESDYVGLVPIKQEIGFRSKGIVCQKQKPSSRINCCILHATDGRRKIRKNSRERVMFTNFTGKKKNGRNGILAKPYLKLENKAFR